MENKTENTMEQQTAQQEGQEKEFKEITLKFGKGCVGDTFTGKDGKDYTQILIPNSDPEDHRPWQTFVVRANAVHEDKFGKGMWTKVPAEGHTTVRRSVRTGEDENGKPTWEQEDKRVTNQELKGMVEFYKTRSNEQEKQNTADRTERAGESDKNEKSEKTPDDKEAHSERKSEVKNEKKTERKSVKQSLSEKKAEVEKALASKGLADKVKTPEVAI